jgi:cap2 methyltransferase
MAALIAVPHLVREIQFNFLIWLTLRAEQQELVTAPLHFSELLVALRVLAHGGTLVLKLFTLFEHVTVSSLLLARVSFERLIVCKPVASKAGNSEVHTSERLYVC